MIQNWQMSLGYRGIQIMWFVYVPVLGHKPYLHSHVPSSTSFFLSYRPHRTWMKHHTMGYRIWLSDFTRKSRDFLSGTGKDQMLTTGNERGFTPLKNTPSCTFFLHSEEVLTACQANLHSKGPAVSLFPSLGNNSLEVMHNIFPLLSLLTFFPIVSTLYL